METYPETSPATNAEGAIVVGVTGSGHEQAALRFAAECAQRDKAEVILVHAFHVHPTPAPSVLITYADAADVADGVVEAAGTEFEEMTQGSVDLGSVKFRTLAVTGTPARVLVDLSRGARMVVVQHHRTHGLRRLFVGSTARDAAAHAYCPVVSVNAEWQPVDPPGEVVVGVDEGGVPREVLESGFAWAAATGAPLRVVHAWRLDAAYDDLITGEVAAEWREKQKELLGSALTGPARRHPDVHISLDVRHHWPAEVLVDDSRVASLVVVGRHSPHRWGPQRLGSLAGTVLREAKSPVMVVPVLAPT